MQTLFLHSDSAGRLVDDVVSMLAFVFASRDFDGSLPSRDRTQDTEHPYIDGSDSKRTVNLHNEALNTFDLYIQLCVSTNVSFPRNEVSQDNAHLRVDILQHVSRATSVAVDAVIPAAGQILVDYHQRQHLQ
jgi:hypothetical protein